MMRLAFLVLIVLSCCFAKFAVDHDLIAQINNNPSSTWKAGVNEKFANLTLAEAKRFLNSFIPPKVFRKQRVSFFANEEEKKKFAASLPDSYDPDEEYPDCKIGIVEQGQCGSSWAFPVTAASGNRFCIAETKKGLSANALYSTQYLLSCESDNFCCNGGYLDKAFDFIEATGLPTDSCFAYNSSRGICPDCPKACDDKRPLKLYKIMEPNTTRTFADVESAMLDIINYGYVASGMDVYNDFINYKSGVYQHVSKASMGGHGIRVNGFGVEKATGLPYWIVANTWGSSWGLNGYAWILRGKNECNIEQYMTAASPHASSRR